MKNNEFKTLITAVNSARTIEELDLLKESVWEHKDTKAMTQRQINIWLEARAARIDEINGAKEFEDHMNCVDCIDTSDVDDNPPFEQPEEDPVIITLLDAKAFNKVATKKIHFSAGYGLQRNSDYITLGKDGVIYACLSPIADPAHSGEIHTIKNQRVAEQIRRTIDYNFKKEGKNTMEKKNVTTPETQTTQPETTQPSAKPVVFDIKDEQQVNKAIERISSKIDNIGKSYLSIVGDVARLKALSAWKITGNKNIYELCNERFGMARGTVHNLLTIFDKYGDKETFKLTDVCAGMSLRQMLAEIAAEKRAELGVEEGGEGDGEGEGGNGGKSSKSKKDKGEVLLNIDFELVGDDWNGEAIAKKLAEQLNEIKDAFADGATVTLTITK